MEKLSAIAQISILLIVAGIIGFVTAWLYWRAKYRNKQRYDQQIIKGFETSNMDKEYKIEKLEKENEKLKGVARQMEKETAKNDRLVPDPLYVTIVKNMGEGVSVSDDEGNFLVFNPRLEQITGYKKEEANKHTEKLFLDKLYPDVQIRQKVTDHIDHIPQNGEYTNIKTVITTKQNGQVPMLVSSTSVDYDHKKYYLTVYRDISEKPEVEA
jgi:PAS domain S-box-containing protein